MLNWYSRENLQIATSEKLEPDNVCINGLAKLFPIDFLSAKVFSTRSDSIHCFLHLKSHSMVFDCDRESSINENRPCRFNGKQYPRDGFIYSIVYYNQIHYTDCLQVTGLITWFCLSICSHLALKDPEKTNVFPSSVWPRSVWLGDTVSVKVLIKVLWSSQVVYSELMIILIYSFSCPFVHSLSGESFQVRHRGTVHSLSSLQLHQQQGGIRVCLPLFIPACRIWHSWHPVYS